MARPAQRTVSHKIDGLPYPALVGQVDDNHLADIILALALSNESYGKLLHAVSVATKLEQLEWVQANNKYGDPDNSKVLATLPMRELLYEVIKMGAAQKILGGTIIEYDSTVPPLPEKPDIHVIKLKAARDAHYAGIPDYPTPTPPATELSQEQKDQFDNDNSWLVAYIDIHTLKGQKGDPGTAGKDGAPGQPGQPGATGATGPRGPAGGDDPQKDNHWPKGSGSGGKPGQGDRLVRVQGCNDPIVYLPYGSPGTHFDVALRGKFEEIAASTGQFNKNQGDYLVSVQVETEFGLGYAGTTVGLATGDPSEDASGSGAALAAILYFVDAKGNDQVVPHTEETIGAEVNGNGVFAYFERYHGLNSLDCLPKDQEIYLKGDLARPWDWLWPNSNPPNANDPANLKMCMVGFIKNTNDPCSKVLPYHSSFSNDVPAQIDSCWGGGGTYYAANIGKWYYHGRNIFRNFLSIEPGTSSITITCPNALPCFGCGEADVIVYADVKKNLSQAFDPSLGTAQVSLHTDNIGLSDFTVTVHFTWPDDQPTDQPCEIGLFLTSDANSIGIDEFTISA